MLGHGRVSRFRVQTNPCIHPDCLARAYTTQSVPAIRPHRSLYPIPKRVDKSNLRGLYISATRPFSTSWIHGATGSAFAASTSPLENSLQLPSGLTFENPEDVRRYLKKWTNDHQKSIKENAPDQVQLQRDAVLPNSLFIRNNTEADAEAGSTKDANLHDEDVDPETEYGGMEEEEQSAFTPRQILQPGDALRITAKNVRDQLAIYLGNRGVQALYFLADGRWLADTRVVFNSYIVRRVATHGEISRIDKYLPLKAVEYIKAEDGGSVPFSALGEVPHAESRPLLDKLAKLAEEVEAARREFPAVNDRLYDAFADENEFRQERLQKLARDILHVDYNTLSEGAKMFIYQEVFQDERSITEVGKNNELILQFLPRKMHRSVVQVTQWARSYQDAAARAATGKSVSEELKDNPLIPFISKARRLISKSRKIRLPTMECQLGPTLESVRPPAGIVERRPTGETFTENEKKIIEFLWLIYAKRPAGQGFGTKRNTAIASLIVRAVGAYPKFRLDIGTGTLFLKELGCLDPWSQSSDYFVTVPSPLTMLHQEARLKKEEVVRAVAELGIQRDDTSPRMPDSMAHLRKDWGDLEVFCVDAPSTLMKDDGISVEQSKECPDEYWVHVHTAHIAAFIPPHSPLLALGPFMGATHYHISGSEPLMPFEAVMPFSLAPDRPVLTFSTLLRPDGSIKDIDVRPGIIRNVINIHNDAFQKVYKWPVTRNSITVGPQDKSEVHTYDPAREQEQSELIQRHKPVFDRLQKLLDSRWQARFHDNPEHLQMFKLPNTATKIKLAPQSVLQEGKGYERIFRSEHLIGDLTITASTSTADFDRATYYSQSIKHNVIAGTMMLACESAALWAAARDIPVIYRFTQSSSETLSKLNSLGPHDPYIAPPGAEGVEIAPSVTLATSGYANITNPLRRYRDLVIHHQINAYLKAKAEQPERQGKEIEYPRSKQDLVRAIMMESDGYENIRLARLQTDQWRTYVMYRAFYFGEAKLPDVWDVFIDNPVNLVASSTSHATTTKGTIFATGSRVQFEPSEQGWEKLAKFRQWLPAKILSISPATGITLCRAVGPPSDKPSLKDLDDPLMQAE